MSEFLQPETDVLTALRPELRRAVEASAANIILRIEPATPSRLESLAALAASEAANAETSDRAQNAFALAAELKRRAALLRN